MLAVSIYVRAKLHESPVFTRMKQQNRLSRNPVKETFGQWPSLKLVLLALVGVTAGQGATYFTGQFYVMIFMQQAVQLDQTSVYTLILIGFIIGAPTFVLFGWLSDRIGRKWIMMAGLFIAAIGYHSMFDALLKAGNPALAQAMQSTPVRIHADASGGACDFGLQAAMIGSHKACRAVGMGNHRNPLPVFIPCHRVIGANGTLTGYAGGLNMKETLLKIERMYSV